MVVTPIDKSQWLNDFQICFNESTSLTFLLCVLYVVRCIRCSHTTTIDYEKAFRTFASVLC